MEAERGRGPFEHRSTGLHTVYPLEEVDLSQSASDRHDGQALAKNTVESSYEQDDAGTSAQTVHTRTVAADPHAEGEYVTLIMTRYVRGPSDLLSNIVSVAIRMSEALGLHYSSQPVTHNFVVLGVATGSPGNRESCSLRWRIWAGCVMMDQ